MYGLVLEGGGAKGSYHVGAYKALLDLDIKIGGVSGTSVGALNGAAIVQGDFNKLVQIWNDIDIESLFGIDKSEIERIKNRKITENGLSYLINLSKDLLSNKGLDTTKLRQLVNNVIDEKKVRKSKMDFGMVTVSLTDRKPYEILKEEIPQGKLVDYIMASANLPVFKMEKLDGKKFIDGCVFDNLPINVLRCKGYTDFIAVRTFGAGRVRKSCLKDINVIYIQPNEDLGNSLEFDKKRAKYNMKLGYFDTIKVFKRLKGYKYYVRPYKKSVLKYLVSLTEKKEQSIINIGKILGFYDMPVDRMLFEKILPRLEMIFEMKNQNDYEDILLRLVESVAEKYNIERFKIYDAEELLALVIQQFIEKPLTVNKKIPTFVRQNKILSLAVKDELVIRIFKEIYI